MPVVIRISLARYDVREDFSNGVTTHVIEANFDSPVAAANEELASHYESSSTVT